MASRVKLTNADKVLYPAVGASPSTTKAQVLEYYTGIAPVMLPHIAGRPVTRKRWPDGVTEEPFFEKKLPPSAPEWLTRATQQHKAGPMVYPVIDSVDALAWIAQQAALEVHVPQWRFVDRDGEKVPGPATRMVFDLDPGEGVDLPTMAEVARAIRTMMSDIDLTTYPVTSGSRGIHLYVPLPKPLPSAETVRLAKRVARELVDSRPDAVTATMTRSERTGKVFIDWSQNHDGKTTVAPYSLRGRAQPNVAAPRTWSELEDSGLAQLRYDEVLERVARDGDLLADLDPGGAARAGGKRRKRHSLGATPRRAAVDIFDELAPMLATQGAVQGLDPAEWAFEGKWDGYRLLVEATGNGTGGVGGGAEVRLRSRSGRDVTAEYQRLMPSLTDTAGHDVILDGELVALDPSGRPNFTELQNRARASRVEFWAFDLLELDGRPLLRVAYRDRRALLETLAAGSGIHVHDLLPGDGAAALDRARALGWEGVVAKQWASTYRPGRRSTSWLKQKYWKTQEVVIGGWFTGDSGRAISSLLMGIPDSREEGAALRFVGRVGTGFTERELTDLGEILAPLRSDRSPFGASLSRADGRGVTFVEPTLVGEVRYGEWTSDGRLRQPSWRGLRGDKRPGEIVREG